eukprot:359138-Chlamydomonas_euryale.AAC.7
MILGWRVRVATVLLPAGPMLFAGPTSNHRCSDVPRCRPFLACLGRLAQAPAPAPPRACVSARPSSLAHTPEMLPGDGPPSTS